MSVNNRKTPASPPEHVAETIATYETKLNQDLKWAMEEGSLHFEEKSAVHATLKKICKRLSELEIPYAVVGGMALFKYGYRRFTEDVDILVARDSLTKIHKELDGLGYRPPFKGSKHLRDSEHKVKIEFLVAGDFPGDGRPKEVEFPDPAQLTEFENDIHYLSLEKLVELKLASGMTGKDRMKDLVDVQALIKILALEKSYRKNLASYVQPKFDELWEAANGHETKYIMLWRKYSTDIVENMDALLKQLEDVERKEEVDLFKRIRADGIQVDTGRDSAGDSLYLFTTDPEIAKKYGMHDERDFMDEPGDG